MRIAHPILALIVMVFSVSIWAWLLIHILKMVLFQEAGYHAALVFYFNNGAEALFTVICAGVFTVLLTIYFVMDIIYKFTEEI